MLEQIESTIVAFVLGAVLTYFTTRWSKTLKKLISWSMAFKHFADVNDIVWPED